MIAPSDETRRAAFAAAEKAGLGHARRLRGVAAFLSGGSLAPPDVAEVPPPPGPRRGGGGGGDPRGGH